MKLPELGSDPTDYLSKPISERKTNLSKIFEIPIRRDPKKPGRELTVLWDKRIPLIKDFENRYSYFVNFTEKGNFAGNHYHKEKQELFTPILGNFKIILENIETKEKEEIELKPSQVLFIPSKTAHKAVSDSDTAILHILASYPNNKEDELEYILK